MLIGNRFGDNHVQSIYLILILVMVLLLKGCLPVESLKLEDLSQGQIFSVVLRLEEESNEQEVGGRWQKGQEKVGMSGTVRSGWPGRSIQTCIR